MLIVNDMFTHNQVCGARMWFPCLDNTSDRATYEMEYTVHSSLVVVSTGELDKQVLSADRTKKTFYYNLDVPSLANSIAFTVAPYVILSAAELDIEGKSKLASIGTYFCLPNRQKELSWSVSFLSLVCSTLLLALTSIGF
jgi:aminopeptidase N